MKILVAVKRVIDYNVKVRVKADGSGVETSNVKMSMNPFDEIAVEEALRIKEAGKAEEVIAVSVGPQQRCQETIRTALAMGADRGILVKNDEYVEPLAVAKMPERHRGWNEQSPGLVILGKQAIDDDCTPRPARCLPPFSAGHRGHSLPSWKSNGDGLKLTREIDGGLQSLKSRHARLWS